MRGFGKAHRSIGLSLWIIYCERRLPAKREGAATGGPMMLQRRQRPSFLMVGPDRGTEFANHKRLAKALLR